MLIKLVQRIPLNSSFLRSPGLFDPNVISELPNLLPILPTVQLCFNSKTLLKHRIELSILAPKSFDQAMRKFNNLIDNKVKKNKIRISKYNNGEVRLDHLGTYKYREISFILKLSFTMSHEQASVRHGFSLNRNILQTNLLADTCRKE